MCAADVILTNSFQSFLHALSSPAPNVNQITDQQDDIWPAALAALIERFIQEPPPSWGEEQRENLGHAIKVRYHRLNVCIPSAVESAMVLMNLLDSQDSRLARRVQKLGPRGTANLDACREMLAGVETRDFSYPQIANTLLFMAMTQSTEPYDPAIFVQGLRQHRAGSEIDWTDVVHGFDRAQLKVTKQQFLMLYNALLPLAYEYANFDIQALWSGQWEAPNTQLSFVSAFLSTTRQELDVSKIPNLRQAFALEHFEGASESVKAFAAEAVKHPLVSQDATEALFTMIFRSQDTYNHAQMLGIPETIINPNMTIFLCAASAVPKPWVALQDQALKQLFYPFLVKHHDNYDFVMHSLWMHDRLWVAARMVEFYQQEQMLLVLIFDHAQEQGWLDLLLTIQSSFAVDLATYAHGKGHCNLEEWAQPHLTTMGPPAFARAIQDFLRTKMDDEQAIQREHMSPQTPPLAVKTVYLLLLLIGEALPADDTGPTYRQCLQSYPRLFNYGENDARNELIDAIGNGATGNGLPEETSATMEEQYKDMYGGKTNPEQLVAELKRLKVSDNPMDQELFAAMLHGLFDEYNCFGEYPNEALATTAVLFGGLIQFHVLSGVAEQAAIHMVFKAVSDYGPDDPMYRFGLQAMIHLLGRIKEWPHLAERILHTPSLRGTQAITAAENALKDLQHENPNMNGDPVNSITNGTIDEEYALEPPSPPFSCVHPDPPLHPDLYEDPDEDISDKVMFVLNNVSKRNIDEKFRDLESALEQNHHQWFAHYLVEELAKTQANFQSLYLQLLQNFNHKLLWAEVLRETFITAERMLNAEQTMNSAAERVNLKNIASWLGSLTLARNQPILHRNISFKDLLIEGHETQRLLVAIPFTCKTLVHAARSAFFRPPNPWTMELLGVLSELYHYFDMKLNLKFEIEMLCKDLGTNVKDVPALEVIRSRPLLQDTSLLQNYVPDGAPDAFGDMHIMGLSKRAPSERFSPDAVIQALPDLGGMLQIPQAAGSVTQPQLRNIFVSAAQQAIYEIIAPVVERSVTIAAISTAELIQKDFSTEADIEKLLSSAQTVVKALSGSLALVTCKEPLRMSIGNNIRILASRSLPEQLPEGQIIMFVNDNIDTVCSLVEQAAEQHSLAEIEAQLAQCAEERRRHAAERPNEPYNNPPLSRWSTIIPAPFSQDPHAGGLNRQQLALYENFGRQARAPSAQHAANQSQDTNRQLPDVLSDSYLHSMSTPAELPAVPRHIAQQQRGQNQQGHLPPHHHVNGYADGPAFAQRVIETLQDLQAAIRDASDTRIESIGDGAPVRQIFQNIVTMVNGAHASQKDHWAITVGNQCMIAAFHEGIKELEVGVFVRLAKHLCLSSPAWNRNLSMQLATAEEDRLFNPTVAMALLREGLLEVQHVDLLATRALKAHRPMVLAFLKDFLDEVVMGEDPVALRSDFVLTYEALGSWLSEEPNLEMGREVLSKLQLSVGQQNGMPSPPHSEKQDQLEYIFEEWVRLQRKDTSERSYIAFVQQLHEQRVVSEPEAAVEFFRAAIEMSSDAFDREVNRPYGTVDTAYVCVDALAKLMALMLVFQSSTESKDIPSTVGSLDAVLRLIILIMNDHHHKRGELFQGRMYFRLFSSLLCELHAARAQLTNQGDDISHVFATAIEILQPSYFPGFVYGWLALLSHRLLVPAFLGSNGRSNGGWEQYLKLMRVLAESLATMGSLPDGPASASEFYRGVSRLFLMIHHDFPEFFIANHLQLNSCIPAPCHQLHNIVNSAVTRSVLSQQPDPFMSGLKMNRLEQVRQAPPNFANLDRILDVFEVRAVMERVCTTPTGGVVNEQLVTILSAMKRHGHRDGRLLINAVVVYVGIQATRTSSVFSSGATPARFLERLLREAGDELRIQFVTALINQVRFVNAHTHYFSTALQHFFNTCGDGIQQAIMRVLVERLSAARPHPWGLITLALELIKSPTTDVFELPWMKSTPQAVHMLATLAQNQEKIGGTRASLGAVM